MTEVATNLANKLDPIYLELHRQQLLTCAPLMAPVPRLGEQPRKYPQINAKDEHVVAAALAIHADLVLTLDRPLAKEIERAALGIPARLPGDFIQLDLITHPFYSRLCQE